MSAGPPGTYAVMTRKKGFKPARMVIILPTGPQEHLQLILESQQQLTFPVNAAELHRQNGLTSTGTNKYTLTAKDITNLPEGEATHSIK